MARQTTQKTTSGSIITVQHYQYPNHLYHSTTEEMENKHVLLHHLYFCNTICMKWKTLDNQPVGRFTVYTNEGNTYQGLWGNKGSVYVYPHDSKKSIARVVTTRPDALLLSSSIRSFITAPYSCQEKTVTNLSFARYSCLEWIHIGDYSFPFITSFDCSNLPKLKSITFGKGSFCVLVNGWPRVCKNKKCCISRNPSLEEITFQPMAFSDFHVFSLKGNHLQTNDT